MQGEQSDHYFVFQPDAFSREKLKKIKYKSNQSFNSYLALVTQFLKTIFVI